MHRGTAPSTQPRPQGLLGIQNGGEHWLKLHFAGLLFANHTLGLRPQTQWNRATFYSVLINRTTGKYTGQQLSTNMVAY